MRRLLFVISCSSVSCDTHPPLSTTAKPTPHDQAASTIASIECSLAFGEDDGQSFGTVYEIRDTNNYLVGGAGFVGDYGTSIRGGRMMLHVFFRKPFGADTLKIREMPRPATDATGLSVFSRDGDLYAFDRSGYGKPAPGLFKWERVSKTWSLQQGALLPYSSFIAGKWLSVTPDKVIFDNRTLLTPKPQWQFGVGYYANGCLFIEEKSTENPSRAKINVFLWEPSTKRRPSYKEQYSLMHPSEFVYIFSSNANGVIFGTNYGRLVAYSGKGFQEISVRSDGSQYYCALNYYADILLGTYPQGSVVALNVSDLSVEEIARPFAGSSPFGREVQILSIYAGDLYAGVWPWGEVYRKRDEGTNFSFLTRLFSHPAMTDTMMHPYELAANAAHLDYNTLGQRITSMCLYGDMLIVATSSKEGRPIETYGSVLTKEKATDYGKIYAISGPAALSTQVKLTTKPIRVTVSISVSRLEIRQDGKLLGFTAIENAADLIPLNAKLNWGSGVFGDSTLTISKQRASFVPIQP